MSPTELVYWLNGFLELSEENKGLTPRQVEIIKEHIALVLTKVTPTSTGDKKEKSKEVVEKIQLLKSFPYCSTDVRIC